MADIGAKTNGWSTTAANNNATAPDGGPEGMAASGVNNWVRELMRALRKWYNDPAWVEYGDGDAGYTPTYVSSTSFRVDNADVTAAYHVGRRVRVTAPTPGTIHGTITNSSFSTHTTVTVTWDSGSLSNETLTSVYISAIPATNQPVPGAAVAAATTAAAGAIELATQSEVDAGTDATRAITPSTLANWDYLPLDNPLINGGLDIWQAGTSFASAASGAKLADMWQWAQAGTMVVDISRSTDVPSVATIGHVANYSLLVDCTTADASIAAGDSALLSLAMEGYVWARFAQRQFSIGFWVKATKTGIYCVGAANSGADRSYVVEFTVNVTDTWEYKTATFSASPSAGTWDYTTGVGLYLRWALAGGSTFQTTAGAWQTGNFTCTSNQVNGMDSTSNNFRIRGVSITAGPVARPYEPVRFGDEPLACQRYYEKSFAYTTAPAQNVGIGTGEEYSTTNIAGATANNWNSLTAFKVRKRIAPTSGVTLYNPAAANAQSRNEGVAADHSATAASGITDWGFIITYTGNAGGAVGNPVGVHWTADARL